MTQQSFRKNFIFKKTGQIYISDNYSNLHFKIRVLVY